MREPTISEERLARIIAYWHGTHVLYCKDGAVTVAHTRGYDSGWVGQ